jgi:hypothetical protein
MQLNHTKGMDITKTFYEKQTNKNKREAYQGHEDKDHFCMIQTAEQLLCKQEDHNQL